MSGKLSPGDRIAVRIEKLVPRGVGLAFSDGMTIFVPLTAEGERVAVIIRRVKGRVAFAEIETILEPSRSRTTPPCEYYGTCGGCDMQHLNYQAQLDAKVGFVRDCLKRIGKIDHDAEIPIIASPNEFGYRARARWHVDRSEDKLGYLQRDSHTVVDITHCPILTPGMQSALDYVRESFDRNSIGGVRCEVEAASDGTRVSVHSASIAEPAGELTIDAYGEQYDLSAESFFQANRSMIDELISASVDQLSGQTALDLYCGVGLFTLPLARKFTHVIGVEESDNAVKLARRNVKRAQLLNATITNSGVGEFLMGHDLDGTDLILLDPPRSGPEKQTIRRIAEIGPKQIVYVSCEPSILARDLAEMIGHGYVIESINALDLFPQTHHVETVVRLTR